MPIFQTCKNTIQLNKDSSFKNPKETNKAKQNIKYIPSFLSKLNTKLEITHGRRIKDQNATLITIDTNWSVVRSIC